MYTHSYIYVTYITLMHVHLHMYTILQMRKLKFREKVMVEYLLQDDSEFKSNFSEGESTLPHCPHSLFTPFKPTPFKTTLKRLPNLVNFFSFKFFTIKYFKHIDRKKIISGILMCHPRFVSNFVKE